MRCRLASNKLQQKHETKKKGNRTGVCCACTRVQSIDCFLCWVLLDPFLTTSLRSSFLSSLGFVVEVVGVKGLHTLPKHTTSPHNAGAGIGIRMPFPIPSFTKFSVAKKDLRWANTKYGFSNTKQQYLLMFNTHVMKARAHAQPTPCCFFVLLMVSLLQTPIPRRRHCAYRYRYTDEYTQRNQR